ncbi:Hypothetical protein CpOVID04_0211 [Corynebacterium pseudotuberculosis]|nr:Hypothetical protein CpCAP1R_0211 [Corynebacterium pseudotuberculosis]QBI72169.1 Hypothetical protein Cp38MAT_0209 [Corynebacterium pseudotuberculosis]QBK59678.1 Hypothetical protein CpE7_0209 [Corynebacterium pseudotuberculosis]QBS28539.1 Hypothetical protein CpCAP1C_0209 [Corynebacterium pseudotuberculosis]QCG71744.1 Hypothetical protein CpOVI1FL_0210 [Corynebacterium pseudotuberculosis]
MGHDFGLLSMEMQDLSVVRMTGRRGNTQKNRPAIQWVTSLLSMVGITGFESAPN